MTDYKAQIVAIGDELISGRLIDSNSSFIATSLRKKGFSVRRISEVGDKLSEIVNELKLAALNSDFIIVTGGLGPTSDDLTRYAIAELLGVNLELDNNSLHKLEDFAKRWNRPLSEVNKRQAYYPANSVILDNPVGTANGFICFYSFCGIEIPIISLPGVPKEMQSLLGQQVVFWLKKRFPNAIAEEARYLRCFGLSESYIGQVIESIGLPEWINVAYRPHFPEVMLTVTGKTGYMESDKLTAEVIEGTEMIRQTLGVDYIYSSNVEDSLAAVVGHALCAKGLTFVAAESCTGGLLADQVVSCAGASNYFLGSVVAYANQVKQGILGVHEETLCSFGAVSKETAVEMAERIRVITNANFGLSITGVAGPEGGTAQKPVGTVWVAIADQHKTEAFQRLLSWSRDYNRIYAVHFALDLLRRRVLGLPLV